MNKFTFTMDDLNHAGREAAVITASLDCESWPDARELGRTAALYGYLVNPFDERREPELFYAYSLGQTEALDEIIRTTLPRVAGSNSGTTPRDAAVRGVGLSALALMIASTAALLPF